MKTKTAVFWGHDNLLFHAVEIFLTDCEHWNVIRVPPEQDPWVLVEQVKRLRPEVVIVHHESHCRESDPLMAILDQHPEFKAIADLPDQRVLTVSLQDNQLQLYSKQSVTIRRASDLLSIIENHYVANQQTDKEVNEPEQPESNSNPCWQPLQEIKGERT